MSWIAWTILILSLIFFGLAKDKIDYDKDLELWHFKESGHTWRDMENGNYGFLRKQLQEKIGQRFRAR